jgi:hypothetical protein
MHRRSLSRYLFLSSFHVPGGGAIHTVAAVLDRASRVVLLHLLPVDDSLQGAICIGSLFISFLFSFTTLEYSSLAAARPSITTRAAPASRPQPDLGTASRASDTGNRGLKGVARGRNQFFLYPF